MSISLIPAHFGPGSIASPKSPPALKLSVLTDHTHAVLFQDRLRLVGWVVIQEDLV